MLTNKIYILFDDSSNFRGVYSTIDNVIDHLEKHNYSEITMSIEKNGRGGLGYLNFKCEHVNKVSNPNHYAIITTVDQNVQY